MKHLLVPLATLLLLALFVPRASAQTDYSGRGATSRFTVGAGAGVGVGIPIGSLDTNVEAAPGFAYRVGINMTYPLARTVGAHLNLGIDSRGFGKKVGGQLDAQNYRATYFFVEPGFNLSSFRLSVNIGLPMSYTQPVVGGTTGQTEDGKKESLSTLIEPRVGATLVLIDAKESWLGMTIDAGFPVGTLYNAEELIDADNDIPSTRPLSIHLGMTYQFAIPGT